MAFGRFAVKGSVDSETNRGEGPIAALLAMKQAADKPSPMGSNQGRNEYLISARHTSENRRGVCLSRGEISISQCTQQIGKIRLRNQGHAPCLEGCSTGRSCRCSIFGISSGDSSSKRNGMAERSVKRRVTLFGSMSLLYSLLASEDPA